MEWWQKIFVFFSGSGEKHVLYNNNRKLALYLRDQKALLFRYKCADKFDCHLMFLSGEVLSFSIVSIWNAKRKFNTLSKR